MPRITDIHLIPNENQQHQNNTGEEQEFEPGSNTTHRHMTTLKRPRVPLSEQSRSRVSTSPVSSEINHPQNEDSTHTPLPNNHHTGTTPHSSSSSSTSSSTSYTATITTHTHTPTDAAQPTSTRYNTRSKTASHLHTNRPNNPHKQINNHTDGTPRVRCKHCGLELCILYKLGMKAVYAPPP